MKCILHIGTEKTGTTSIQSYLHLNKNKLSEQGIGLIDLDGNFNNRDLVSYCLNDNKFDDYFYFFGIHDHDKRAIFRTQFEKKFDDAITTFDDSINTVILSSEQFHSRVTDLSELVTLKIFLEKYFNEIKIIIYLRKQVDCVVSLFSTELLYGGVYSKKTAYIQNYDFLQTLDSRWKVFNAIPNKFNSTYFDYFNLLNLWETSFSYDSIIVRPFKRKLLFNKNVVHDFMYQLGLNTNGTLYPNELNESLSKFSLKTLYIYNYLFPRISGTNIRMIRLKYKIRSLFVRLILRRIPGTKYSITKSDSERFQNQFSRSNLKVIKKWKLDETTFD